MPVSEGQLQMAACRHISVIEVISGPVGGLIWFDGPDDQKGLCPVLTISIRSDRARGKAKWRDTDQPRSVASLNIDIEMGQAQFG